MGVARIGVAPQRLRQMISRLVVLAGSIERQPQRDVRGSKPWITPHGFQIFGASRGFVTFLVRRQSLHVGLLCAAWRRRIGNGESGWTEFRIPIDGSVGAISNQLAPGLVCQSN